MRRFFLILLFAVFWGCSGSEFRRGVGEMADSPESRREPEAAKLQTVESESQVKQQMDKLQGDLTSGKINRRQYQIRKWEIERGLRVY